MAETTNELDKAVDDMEKQLDTVLSGIETLAKMGASLKTHQKEQREQWKLTHADRFAEILRKAKNMDNIMYQNF